MLFLKSISQKEVHVYLLEDCPIANYYGPTIRNLQRQYPDVTWRFIFPNSYSDSLTAVFVRKHELKNKTVERNQYSELINADQPIPVSPSVVISNNKSIVYKGAIDDAYAAIGKRRMVIQHHYVASVLKQINQKLPFIYFETEPVGCLLSLPKSTEK
jgi:hypothetical protein